MKIFLTTVFFLFTLFASFGQRLSATEINKLKKQEDSLKTNAAKILYGRTAKEKFEADSLFTKGLVRALINKNSFYFPFDSLVSISKQYPADSSFRIITWQMLINEKVVRQHGAIQMKTADGSLKLFPLIDKSDVTTKTTDTIADNRAWMGAVYYKIVEKSFEGKKYYTLLGFDENTMSTDKKVIEVVTFNDGKPQFGGRYFVMENGKPNTMARYELEYKKQTSPKLGYDDGLDMIVMEHLVSETNEPNKKYTLVPDGDYEGFKWINGRWVYVAKIFNEVTELGNAPVPTPIRDDQGNIDYKKLKGSDEERPVVPAKPKKKVKQ